jgi:hypothetical protein
MRFNKKEGHFIPDNVNPASDEFASRLLEQELAAESKEVYNTVASAWASP